MKNTKILDAVLLIALPASGKSEVRRYIEYLRPERRAEELRMGESVQLDDYPYVHLMRRIDDEAVALGKDRFFFYAPDRTLRDPYHWGTLIELLNEDHADIMAKKMVNPPSAGLHYLQRLDAAARKCGAAPLLDVFTGQVLQSLADALEKETRKMLAEKQAAYPDTLQGKTLVIEFARGGPEGANMPLPAPMGYGHSLSLLSEDILRKTAILYVKVTPEECRRRNLARTDPNDPGSILHHGVPAEVMKNDYGCDDIDWLTQNSERPDTITVRAHGKTFHVPFAAFDNRVDKTSFLRDDPKSWDPEKVRAVSTGLKDALQRIPA